jgi:hypothetical protein
MVENPQAIAKIDGSIVDRTNSCNESGVWWQAQEVACVNTTLVPEIAAEAKALVALAFRNGPIEDSHSGKLCPACSGESEFSHISDEEMKTIMKSAVDTLYRLLWQREYDAENYQRNVAFGLRYTTKWDDPELETPILQIIEEES